MQPIERLMSPGLETISLDDTAQRAAKRMEAADVGVLPVMNGTELAGVVTDRDLALGVVAEARSPLEIRVGELMTPDCVTVRRDDGLEIAAARMSENRIKRVVVVDDDGKPCGVLSLGDLAVHGEHSLCSATTAAVCNGPARPVEAPAAGEDGDDSAS